MSHFIFQFINPVICEPDNRKALNECALLNKKNKQHSKVVHLSIQNLFFSRLLFKLLYHTDHSIPGGNEIAKEKIDSKADDFNTTDDRKPSEEPHCSSYC